jgi:hypothetical protein
MSFFITLAIIIVIVLVVILIFNHLFAKTNIIYDDILNAQKSKVIKNSDLPDTNISNFTTSIWFYVNEWSQGTNKNIMYIAKTSDAVNYNFGTSDNNLSHVAIVDDPASSTISALNHPKAPIIAHQSGNLFGIAAASALQSAGLQNIFGEPANNVTLGAGVGDSGSASASAPASAPASTSASASASAPAPAPVSDTNPIEEGYTNLGSDAGAGIIVNAINENHKNLSVFLGPNENNLHIQIQTFNNNSNNTSQNLESTDISEFIIPNVELQKWVCLTISVDTRTMDVYINGKLINSYVLPGTYKPASDNNVYLGNTKNNAFNGFITRFRYIKHDISPEQSYAIYKDGINSSMLGNAFNKYRLKVSFLEYDNPVSSFTL